MSDHGPDPDRIGSEIAAGLAAGTVAAALPGPLADLVANAAYPMLLKLTKKVAAEWNDIRWVRSVRSIQVATETAGVTEDDLTHRLRERTELLELAGKAAQGAADARYDARIKALGVALARGILQQDDAQLDEEFFLVAALTDLEVPHVRLLDFLATNAPPGRGSIMVSDGMIRQVLPQLAPVHEVLTEVLRRHGLIREVPEIHRGRGPSGNETFSSRPYTYVTRLGGEVLARLREVGMEEIEGDNAAPRIQ